MATQQELIDAVVSEDDVRNRRIREAVKSAEPEQPVDRFARLRNPVSSRFLKGDFETMDLAQLEEFASKNDVAFEDIWKSLTPEKQGFLKQEVSKLQEAKDVEELKLADEVVPVEQKAAPTTTADLASLSLEEQFDASIESGDFDRAELLLNEMGALDREDLTPEAFREDVLTRGSDEALGLRPFQLTRSGIFQGDDEDAAKILERDKRARKELEDRGLGALLRTRAATREDKRLREFIFDSKINLAIKERAMAKAMRNQDREAFQKESKSIASLMNSITKVLDSGKAGPTTEAQLKTMLSDTTNRLSNLMNK